MHLTTISSRKLRRTLAAEVAISILINGFAIPAVIWAVDVAPPKTLGGGDGVIVGLAMATALPVFFMTLLITLGVHARLRKEVSGRGDSLHAVPALPVRVRVK